jgi:hypothetical protein
VHQKVRPEGVWLRVQRPSGAELRDRRAWGSTSRTLGAAPHLLAQEKRRRGILLDPPVKPWPGHSDPSQAAVDLGTIRGKARQLARSHTSEKGPAGGTSAVQRVFQLSDPFLTQLLAHSDDP